MKNLFRQFLKTKIYLTAILVFVVQTGFTQTNLITNGNFENGTTGWTVWGATLTTSTDAHGGNSAAFVTNRKNPWDAIVQNVKNILENGESYTISAWVKMPSPAVNFRITLGMTINGSTTYQSLCGTAAPIIGTYEFYTQTFTLNWNGTLEDANIYIENESVGGVYSDYLADDIVLEKYTPEPPPVIEGEGLKDLPGLMRIGGVVGGMKNYFNDNTAKAQVLKDCNAIQITCYPAWGRWDKTIKHVYHVEEFSEKIREMKKQNLNVTAHMLLGWDQYFPDWYKKGDFPADTLEAIMQSWLKAIITTQGNDTLVDTWNIVNEAISWDGKGGYWPLYNSNFNDACEMQRMGFEPDASGLSGSQYINSEHPVYIRKAFEYARTLTNKKLELRDSGFEFPGTAKYNAFYQLAKHLKEMNAPVDVIGFQTHLDIETTYDWVGYENNIKRYIDLGYEVIIPEVDIGDVEKDWTEEKAQLQKKQYYNLIMAAIKGGASEFQTWGFIDNNEAGWRYGESAFPYANNFAQKPAYYGIKEALIDMSSILFWEMDETLNDTMPDVMKYNNFGKLNYFDTPVFVQGFKKNALQFDGVDDYISINKLSDSISSDFTFSCYIKTGVQKAGTIADFIENGNSWLKIVINNDGKIVVISAETVLDESLESNFAVNDDVWHFIALQRDSTSYKLYIDDSTPIAVGSGNLKEFRKLMVGAFEGAVDEVKLYDSAIEEASFTRNFSLENQIKLESAYSRMRVKLDWTDKNNEEVGFVVDRKIGDGNWEVAGEVKANVLYFIENINLYDTNYFYRVRSSSRFANSGTSNVVTVLTPNDPNTGISGAKEQLHLLVYPNPVHDEFTLYTSGNLWMKIYDIRGNLLLERSKCAATETIDISDFLNGVYFLQSCSDNKTDVVKLVKE